MFPIKLSNKIIVKNIYGSDANSGFYMSFSGLTPIASLYVFITCYKTTSKTYRMQLEEWNPNGQQRFTPFPINSEIDLQAYDSLPIIEQFKILLDRIETKWLKNE